MLLHVHMCQTLSRQAGIAVTRTKAISFSMLQNGSQCGTQSAKDTWQNIDVYRYDTNRPWYNPDVNGVLYGICHRLNHRDSRGLSVTAAAAVAVSC